MHNKRQEKTQFTLVEAPPVTEKVLPARVDAPKTRLRLVSRRKNQITDGDAWFSKNGLTPPYLALPDPQSNTPGSLPVGMPTAFEGMGIVGAYPQAGGNTVVGVYGPEFGAVRYVAAWDGTEKVVRYAFDLGKFTRTNRGKTRLMGVNYAREDDGILFFISDIGGYAKESGGKNGYLTALEVKTGKLLWRSAPLTANSRSLEILGETVACGYGFTSEPDYVYLLDKRTGRLLQRNPVASAPEFLQRRADRLYVRCYDTDYVFAVTGL